MRSVGLVMLIGCGRVGFDPIAGDAEASLWTYRDEVLADRPLAYWRLDDTDATARDETERFPGSYATAGCTRGAAGALAGDPDRAVRFDGVACKVDVGNNFAFAPNAQFTIELWYAETAGGDTYQELFSRQVRNGNPIHGYALVRATADPVGLYFERVIGSQVLATNAYKSATTAFTHAVAIYDGADSELFVDGALFGSFSDDRAMGDFSANAFIGAAPDPAANDNQFLGVIDEVAIYDRALPAERVRAHYQIGISGPIPR